jgi:hypothetical protein
VQLLSARTADLSTFQKSLLEASYEITVINRQYNQGNTVMEHHIHVE